MRLSQRGKLEPRYGCHSRDLDADAGTEVLPRESKRLNSAACTPKTIYRTPNMIEEILLSEWALVWGFFGRHGQDPQPKTAQHAK